MTLRRKSGEGTPPSRLDRHEIVQTALRQIDRDGLEALSLRKLASELRVTPAAIYWHVRSKEELLDAVIETAFKDLTPPACDRGRWRERARELYHWFRGRLLEQQKLLLTPAFGRILPHAFLHVGIAGKNILKEAGFTGADLVQASRALYWHTFAFVLNEAGMSRSPLPTSTPQMVLDGTIEEIAPEEFSAFIAYVRSVEVNHDAVYEFSLACLLDSLERDLERRSPPRQRGASKRT